MKITIITTNGITTEFNSWPERLQARGLAARGHQVTAVTYSGNKSWNRTRKEIIDGVPVERFKPGYFPLPLVFRLLAGPRPDIVHLHHLSNQFSYSVALICKLRRIPLVMTPHGLFHDPYLVADRDRPFDSEPRYSEINLTVASLLKSLFKRFKPKRQLKNYLTHAPLKLVDRVIALSQHGRGVLLRLGLEEPRIRVIANGIDPDWLRGLEPTSRHGNPQILYLGQFKYRKGFDLLAKAMPGVIREFPEAKFVFAGHSPILQPELLRLAVEGGVEANLVLPGSLAENDKGGYFLASDLYVLPTRYEGFGIPLIEAMSAGCPVISTNLPVIDEIIRDGENGLLAPPEDPAGLARTIIRVLKDQELSSRLVSGGKQSVTGYYTPLIMEQLEKVYQELQVRPKPQKWLARWRLERPAR